MADAYLGEIRAFAGAYAPQDWLICDGSLLQISNYNALFALIGTTYGGDGVQTFKIPDLRGRLAVAMGQGAGLTNRTIGSNGGTEQVQLTTAQIPAHSHTMTVSTVTNPPSVNVPSTVTYLGSVSSPTASGVGYLPGNAAGLTVQALNQSAITPAGNSSFHSNIMPVAVVSYMICMNGLFPTHS
ncbi:phage tail protein [Mucilaginibacter paludis]|uniref:Tail Collar domain protein n=1 Tax=Mucilaginibacter paludis DSM 18603 TaxID=714943 RepID=H1Y2C0_9SPHI|nr:tail fiber protein [Mucilaginibacter paludis]EHQ27900.1 Tail Collar domain protein [Mucilaginibacter paludis DSM 18603]